MLQKWKRKGKRFRHVEKDGEETTELSVKIRAAKFRDLPMSLRILIVNAWQETGTARTMYASSRTARFCRGRTTSMQ